MTANEYLHRADNIRRQIEVRQAMITEKESAAEYKGINYEAVGSHTAGGNSTEAAFISVADFESLVGKELAMLKSQLREIKSVILRVGDGLQEQILTKRYIEGKGFPVVAKEIGYTERQMFRHYNRALKKVDEILKMSVNVIECQ
jgi:hypothetical protein